MAITENPKNNTQRTCAPDTGLPKTKTLNECQHDAGLLAGMAISGVTCLMVWNGGETVVSETPNMKSNELRSQVPLDADGNRIPYLTIPCNPIFDRVVSVLGGRPDALLDEAYPEDAS